MDDQGGSGASDATAAGNAAGADGGTGTATGTDRTATTDGPSDEFVLRPIAVAVGLGILGPVLMLAIGFVVGLASLALGLSQVESIALLLVAGQWLGFGGLALGYLRFRGFDWSGVRAYLGIEVPDVRDVLTIVGGYVLIFATIMVINVLVAMSGAEPGSNQSAELTIENPELVFLLIPAMFLVVGPCEELLYRGVVQGRLREYFGWAVSIGLASLIFASVHVVALTGGLEARLLTVAILFFPSLVFGAVYEFTDNLVVPVVLHAIHNSVLLLLLYVVVTYGDASQLNAILPAIL